MRLLVTRATGVLGRRVLSALTPAGHAVTAVSRGKADQVRDGGGVPVNVDLFYAAAVKSVVNGPDVVADLATSIPATNRMALPWAWKGERPSAIRGREQRRRCGDRGRGALHPRVDRAGVPDAGHRWVDEDARLDPIVNTRRALEAEAAARAVTAAGGVGVARRFASFYGPDRPHTRVVFASAAKGIAPVFGNLDRFLPQLHLDDAAAAVIAAIEAPAGVYNIIEDQPLRRREIVDVLEGVADRQLRTPLAFLAKLGPPRATVRSRRLDNARFREATGWTPVYSDAGEGLRAVAAEIDVGRDRA